MRRLFRLLRFPVDGAVRSGPGGEHHQSEQLFTNFSVRSAVLVKCAHLPWSRAPSLTLRFLSCNITETKPRQSAAEFDRSVVRKIPIGLRQKTSVAAHRGHRIRLIVWGRWPGHNPGRACINPSNRSYQWRVKTTLYGFLVGLCRNGPARFDAAKPSRVPVTTTATRWPAP